MELALSIIAIVLSLFSVGYTIFQDRRNRTLTRREKVKAIFEEVDAIGINNRKLKDSILHQINRVNDEEILHSMNSVLQSTSELDLAFVEMKSIIVQQLDEQQFVSDQQIYLIEIRFLEMKSRFSYILSLYDSVYNELKSY